MDELKRKILEHIDTPLFRKISEVSEKLGVKCYVIGGYVRDLIIGRQSKDIDIVVSCPEIERPGIALANALASTFNTNDVTIYPNFGTAQIKTKEGDEIELVGARKESYDRGSRKPITEDGTLEDDQNRRDFTINAMAISLNVDDFGTLVDPFDGIGDISRKTIRTPLDPNITFSDDPLRMMRCVRFATQLGYDVSPETLNALETNKDRIRIISGERIADEFIKIMKSSCPSRGIRILEKSGLLRIILPEVAALGKGNSLIRHKDIFEHTMKVLDNVVSATMYNGWNTNAIFQDTDENLVWLRIAALLHDIGKPAVMACTGTECCTFHDHEHVGARMIPNLFKRMKFPTDYRMEYVKTLVDLHMRPHDIVSSNVTDSAVRRLVYDASDSIGDLMILCKSDITTKHEDRKKNFIYQYENLEKRIEEIENSDHIRNFQPVVTGDDIMCLFGLKPSKIVGEIKASLKDAILDGIIKNSVDEAMQFILGEGIKMGLTPKKYKR